MAQPSEQYVIAVVDDDASVCRAVGRLLTAHGFVAQSYASSSAFLREVGQRRIDAVVLDLHMEGLTGLQVMHRLRDTNSRIPVVILTGHGLPKSRSDAIESGASAFLEKPVDESVLISTIQKLIDERQLK